MPNNRFTKEEVQYIRDNALTQTDEQIGKYLKRSTVAIRKNRLRLGIHKTSNGKLVDVNSGDPRLNDHIRMKASQKMSESDRRNFFIAQLTNNLSYNTLKQQFTKDEIDFYLEEWGSLCVQFEDVVATEKRQIHELIVTTILGSRILKNVKLTELEIHKLQKEVEEYRKKHDMADDMEAQERDRLLVELVQRMAAQSDAMTRDYHKNQEMKNNLLSELNARRRDRIDHLTKAGTTFLGLVQAFREREVREAQGRHMELVRLSKEKKKSEFRKMEEFPEGQGKDCILLDDQSEPVIEGMKSDMINEDLFLKYVSNPEKKKILIVEDDNYRIQLFQNLLKNHSLSFASNAEKALKKLDQEKYDLVCLDYDIGLNDKGSVVAQRIKDKNIECEVLIHSNNPEGAKETAEILPNAKVLSFKDIASKAGEYNAKVN